MGMFNIGGMRFFDVDRGLMSSFALMFRRHCWGDASMTSRSTTPGMLFPRGVVLGWGSAARWDVWSRCQDFYMQQRIREMKKTRQGAPWVGGG